ncbi:hypothetical protein Hanom_Chr11g01051091 [Helianthus anomalus]
MFVCPFGSVMPFLMFLCFTVGYNLLNVLDPKVGGAMIEAILPEGRPVWLDQIRNRFLHPTSDSFAAYANTILGEDDEEDFDDTTDPTREKVIVLSSEGSDRSHEGLIPHSSRAGLAQGAANEPMNEPVDVDADLSDQTAEQLETRRKKKLDKSEEKEKRVEEDVTETPRAGEKRVGRDPDDNATPTEMMKKKALEDKKKKLDEQAVAALTTKRAKLQKEAPPAPSESEIDMGVFTTKHGNLLEKIFVASGSHGTMDDVEIEQVGVGGAAGAGGDAGGAGGGVQGKGVDTEAKSSEATPRHTIYTRRPPGSAGGATSGLPRSPEYENIQAGS